MNLKRTISNYRLPGRAASPLTAGGAQVSDGAHGVTRPTDSIVNRKSEIVNGFTLVEILVVVVLLSFIVLALMAVFNGTQAAFRASVTQSDVLEGGRSVMGMIKSDLEGLTPSYGISSNSPTGSSSSFGPVNFFVSIYDTFTNNPMVQPLTGSSNPNFQRTNVLEEFYILTRQNTTWTGVGYKVDLNSTNYFNPLYRYSMSTNVMAADPTMLFNYFDATPITNMSHLIDGVVDLRVRAFDPQGRWINIVWANGAFAMTNITFAGPEFGETQIAMRSNMVPASVEIYLGVLEDRTLQRAESIGDPTVRSNYLAQQAGKVHVFRQRVPIRSVDPSAYK